MSQTFFNRLWQIIRENEGKSKGSGTPKGDGPDWRPLIADEATDSDKMGKRVRAFLAERGPAISGSGGHNHTLSIAEFIHVGLNCSREETFTYMWEWNDTLRDPWTEQEIWHKIDDAPKMGGVPGYALNAERKPRNDPEEAWLNEIVFFERRGRRLYKHGPGARFELVGVEPAPTLSEDMFADILNLPPPTSPSPWAAPYVHVPPDATFCPHHTTVQHYDGVTRTGFEQDHPCKALRCEFCGPLVRNHWQVSLRHHLHEYGAASDGEDLKPLYTFHCSEEDWPRVHKALSRRKASYFRVDGTAGGTLYGPAPVVVSTHRPPNVDAAPITPQAAADFLCKLIDQLSTAAPKGCFTKSRDWKLLPDGEKKPPRFICLGRLDSTAQQREDVRRDRGISTKHISGKGRFYPRRGVIYSIGQRDWKHLLEELRFGETLPEGPVSWGKTSAAAEPDEWATHAPPDPEPAYAGVFDFRHL